MASSSEPEHEHVYTYHFAIHHMFGLHEKEEPKAAEERYDKANDRVKPLRRCASEQPP